MFRKHPKGLLSLFIIEMWERFGFYIMSAVYVLYMDKELKLDDSTKGTLYGVFLLVAYTFPMLGGYLGDRVIGQVKTITIGSWMMALGYLGLAISSIDQTLTFYLGLIFVAIGTGIFKVNMSILVGNLYHNKKALKDAGFNIYYMGVNVGAAVGPTAAGFLGYLFTGDYRASFFAAAIGMLVAVLSIHFGKKNLTESFLGNPETNVITVEENIGRKEFVERVLTLVVLFFIAALFWIPFYQNGFALTLFAERSTVAVDWLRPETYVAFNAYFILLLTPPLLWLYAKLRTKQLEPTTPMKIFLGFLTMGAAMLIMMLASLVGGNSDQQIMSPFWLIGTYLIITVAELLISPMGQSYVSKVAPAKIKGLMMGGWFCATALGAFSAGIFGNIYSDVAHHQYFLILAGICFFAALLTLLFLKKLKKFAS